MSQQQPTSTHQATSQIAPIDPTPIAQSESPTAVILATLAPRLSIAIQPVPNQSRQQQ